MSQAHECSELPAEVTARPLPLVALAGLDTLHNAVHRAVWDALSARRPAAAAAAPLRCQLLPSTYELPVVKPKRTSYEWYIPKGILKKNWIPKRLSLVPAVIVVFYDLEWDEPQWNERVLECASRVQSIRAACEGHGTRLAVVALQGAPAPPPTECPLGAERAQQLCAACELPSKALFVLPTGPALAGCAQRLEAALLDLAHCYYHSEARAVRQHRDQLNKTTHHYLVVRHQFKLGFLNELKRDAATALKHYQQAYAALLETRLVDTNVHEVRTVAGYVHYKLCRLLFALNMPRDAIAQQRHHLEQYRGRSGPNELMFEHYAWLAAQHAAFAELFEDAVRAGLPATRAHHPGLYWQQAAALTARRRQSARALIVEGPYPEGPDPLVGPVEYYGQRPWRPGRLGAEPPDPQRERTAVLALQLRERGRDLAPLMVSLLGNAVSQLKAFHSPRARRQLLVEMADEYYDSGDYGKALTLLTHVVPEYRAEGWRALVARVQARALHCAYLTARVNDYVPLLLHALSATTHHVERERLLANVGALLALRPPQPEPGVPTGAVAAAAALWTAAAPAEPLALSVECSGLVQVKVQWSQPSYAAEEPARAMVYVRLSRGPPLSVTRAQLSVSAGARTLVVPLPLGAPCHVLQPNTTTHYTCDYTTDAADGACELTVTTVTFVLHPDDKRAISLNFNMNDNRVTESARHPELIGGRQVMDGVVQRLTCSVRARACRLSGRLQHRAPALQADQWPVTLELTNNETSGVTQLTLMVSLVSAPDTQDVEGAVELSAPGVAPTGAVLTLPPPAALPPGASSCHPFHVRCPRAVPATLQVRATYRLADASLECVALYTTTITVIKPFDVSAQYTAADFTPITKCFPDMPFVVMPQISVLSPYELIIEETTIEPTERFSVTDEGGAGVVRGVRAVKGETVRDAVSVRAVGGGNPGAGRVGLYTVRWRRCEGGPVVRSSAPLPPLATGACGLSARLQLSAAHLTCTLVPAGSAPLRLLVSVEGSDAFMVAGYRRRAVTLRPGAPLPLQFVLRPLLAGPARPPALRAAVLDPAHAHLQDDLTLMLSTLMPHTIFVPPHPHHDK